jgi:CDP-diacylglycerol--glycerol-3-phosphate 3-phosphatidyltransferase
MNATILRHVPNLISVARIVATPVLLILALKEQEDAFKWLLLGALLSDIADGLIAMTFSLTSALGARLDTLGDTLVWIAVVVGIWKFHPALVTDFKIVFVLVIGFWVLQHIVSLLRYRKLTSFHTYVVRISAYALGIFVMSMFLWGVQPWLLYLAAGLSIAGSIEELIIIALLPEWTANVRGLYFVIRQRRADST